MTREEFESWLKKNKCPFCGRDLKYYDGALGYDALKCYPCKFTIDHSGMHLE